MEKKIISPFFKANPELARYWDFEGNNGPPAQSLVSGSAIKAHWVCDQYDFAFYKPGATGVYAWTEWDSKTLASPSTDVYSPFVMGEERSVSFFIAVPKDHAVSELVFYLRTVDSKLNLYYFPME